MIGNIITCPHLIDNRPAREQGRFQPARLADDQESNTNNAKRQ
jgi:hypothetical protein